MKRKLILASTSPRRKELLSQIGLDFEVIGSQHPEELAETLPANVTVQTLATAKAGIVAMQQPEAIVIGADTIVVLDNTIFGKPANKAEARQMLHALSGKKHQVMTAISLQCRAMDKRLEYTSVTDVYFRVISDDEIDTYVDSGEPMDKAGAYGIQGHAAVFVEKIAGDYFTVVGLPLMKTWQFIEQLQAESRDV